MCACNRNENEAYKPTIYGVGIAGNKYPRRIKRKQIKEFIAWTHMLRRCFDAKYKEKHSTYKNVTCCEEWLLYENFYEWLHSQENFDKWLNNNNWTVDKDILFKGNKIYSPDTCCLVPQNVNKLFTHNNSKGNLPIGVSNYGNKKYKAMCHDQSIKKYKYIGIYDTIEEAFQSYKKYKENLIKQVSQEEYDKGNITKSCYNAMMKYEVEITD